MSDTATVMVLVEDEPDMRTLIKIVLARDARLEVVGEAASGDEAVRLAGEFEPGLVILDHSIEGNKTGLETAPEIKAVAPDSKILLFTAYDMAAEARREPAIDGYLRKDELAKLLPTVLRLLGLDPPA